MNLFLIFFALGIQHASAIEIRCRTELEGAARITWYFSSKQNLLISNTIRLKTDGSSESSSVTAHIALDVVCGTLTDFSKSCTAEEKAESGQYQYSFACKSGVNGKLYFDEVGTGELRCNKPDARTDVSVLLDCKRL